MTVTLPVYYGIEVLGAASGNTQLVLPGFSNLNPGTVNVNYHYESQASIDWLAARGWRYIRIPISWERFQPGFSGGVVAGALNSTQVGYLTAEMNYAYAAGMKCTIDIHNYGGYYLDGSLCGGTAGTGYFQQIGASTYLPYSSFTSLWTELATQFSGHPALLAYELMNEPQPSAGMTQANWTTASQDAVNAIRAVDTVHPVIVDGWNFSNAATWTENNPATPWIADATGLIWYSAHHYPEQDTEEQAMDTYAQVLADNVAEYGYTAGIYPDAMFTKMVTEVNNFLGWCSTNNVNGQIGEFGFPAIVYATGDQNLWNRLMTFYLQYLSQNGGMARSWMCNHTGEFFAPDSDPLLIYQASNAAQGGPLNQVLGSAVVYEQAAGLPGTVSALLGEDGSSIQDQAGYGLLDQRGPHGNLPACSAP